MADQIGRMEQPCRPEECVRKEPNPIDRELAHTVRIVQYHIGYVVDVGCKSFTFQTLDEVLYYLEMYMKDPNGTRNKLYEGTLFIKDKEQVGIDKESSKKRQKKS